MDKNIAESIEKIEKTSELGYMFWSILCGVLMTVAYDFLRARRREKNVPAMLIYLEDAAWFAALGIILYVLAFKENSGMVRWYSFLGAGLGALIYKILFGDKVMKLLRKAYCRFISAVCFIIKAVLLPVKVIFGAAGKPIHIVAWHTRESSEIFKTYFKVLRAKIKNRIRITSNKQERKNDL